MIISDVLDAKGRQIETVRPAQRISEIIALFAARNISSVLVVNAAMKPVGIVTDRIVVNAMASHGRDTLALTAADVMQVPVPVCRAQDSVQRAMEIMTDRRVRHLLVLVDGDMVGIVSIGDLVKYRIRDAELENGVLRDLVPAWAASA